MLRFERPGSEQDGDGGEGPGSFDFLGFTHFWGRTRKGGWAVKRKTASDRLTRAICRLDNECRHDRHLPVEEQRQALNQKLRGHYNYYGIIGNFAALDNLFYLAKRAWRKWLNRRGGRCLMSWESFELLLGHYPLLKPWVVHGLGRPWANP